MIVLAVSKAFKEMVFISVLMFIFFYIFAIIGTIFFDYSTAAVPLKYENSFRCVRLPRGLNVKLFFF